MIHILIASQDKDSLMEFSAGLDTNDVEITWTKDCEHVISKIENNKFDLLIVDETLSDTKGLECIEKIIMNNPFLNTAAISSLSSKDFHEESEGFGVLMQIPVNPGSEDGEKMLDYLNKILKLTNRDL
ncbi:MAG: response regulator [Desulfobacteraceae bacterium]|nr:response regulator [Desulfobacteraceae bacterium]